MPVIKRVCVYLCVRVCVNVYMCVSVHICVGVRASKCLRGYPFLPTQQDMTQGQFLSGV